MCLPESLWTTRKNQNLHQDLGPVLVQEHQDALIPLAGPEQGQNQEA